mgnify:CR=1 FL=1
MAKASIEGWAYAAGHREATIDTVMKYIRQTKSPANRAHAAWMLDAMIAAIFPKQPGAWTPGSLDAKTYAGTVRLMIVHGMLTNAPAFEDFTVAEFCNAQ